MTENTSLNGDALKPSELNDYRQKGLFVIVYEHEPARIGLDPLIAGSELIARKLMTIPLAERVEERRD
mgnify:CR=1 FL=1